VIYHVMEIEVFGEKLLVDVLREERGKEQGDRF
jgi:hypothetical protein